MTTLVEKKSVNIKINKGQIKIKCVAVNNYKKDRVNMDIILIFGGESYTFYKLQTLSEYFPVYL